MQVRLPPALEQLVRHKVKSGRYNDPSEVVRASLLLLAAQDERQAVYSAWMRDRLRRTAASAAQGARAAPVVPRGACRTGADIIESVFGALYRRAAARKLEEASEAKQRDERDE